MLVLTLVFHTYLAHVVSKARRKEPISLKIGSQWFSKNQDTNTNEDYNELEKARQLNNVGKIIFFLTVITFNLGFWYTAIKEYVRPAEDYLN